jgi:hypothetical protein
MDKKNFAFEFDDFEIVMEDGELVIFGSLDGNDPTCAEYSMSIKIAELMEENKKLKESNEAYRQEVKELRFGL